MKVLRSMTHAMEVQELTALAGQGDLMVHSRCNVGVSSDSLVRVDTHSSRIGRKHQRRELYSYRQHTRVSVCVQVRVTYLRAAGLAFELASRATTAGPHLHTKHTLVAHDTCGRGSTCSLCNVLKAGRWSLLESVGDWAHCKRQKTCSLRRARTACMP